MNFSKEQQAAIDSRNENVIVSASAGSGKTSVLVERLCQLVLKDRIGIDRILAMTFTKDAAGEMKDRLRSSLEKALAESRGKDDYISGQLAFLETADICTIDSFCLSVVENYYYLHPDLTLEMTRQTASQAQQDQLFAQAYHKAQQSLPLETVSSLQYYFYAMGIHEEDTRKLIHSFIDVSASKPNPMEWMRQVAENRFQSEIDRWFQKAVLAHLKLGKEAYEEIKDWHPLFETRWTLLAHALETFETQGYEAFYDAVSLFLKDKKNFPNIKQLPEGTDKSLYEDYKSSIKKTKEWLGTNLFPARLLREDEKKMRFTRNTFCELCIRTKQYYQQLKKEEGLLDFSDMSLFAYELIEGKEIVREELTEKYRYILVDEFQDTNDIQEKIIELISNGDNVFRVGDIKQAIYGFRQARPALMKKHLDSDTDRTIVMDQNFRSHESIISFNNDFYQKIMNTPGLDPQFTPEDIAKVGSERQSRSEQIPFRYLYTEYGKIEGNKNNLSSLANKNRYDIIAHDIMEQHKKGVAYKDICILTRQRPIHEAIRDALEAYGIPVLAEINHGFYKNAAVQIVLSAMKAILDPNDDIALCATLFSEIGQVRLEQLAVAKHKTGSSLYQKIKDEPFMEPFHALAKHRKETVTQLIQSIYATHDFYMAHSSSLDKTHLDALLEKAGSYPYQSEVLHFIRDQEPEAKKDSEAEAFPYGKDADVVRIKTMHQSKGLQFPVVYLLGHDKSYTSRKEPVLMDSDLGLAMATLSEDKMIKRFNKEYVALEHKKRMDAIYEEMRVFYVATTRAEKECILVDALKDMEKYLAPLHFRHVLNKVNYTDWLLYTYFGQNDPLIRFEEHPIYERPEAPETIEKRVSFKTYQGKRNVSETVTASALKQKQQWKPLDLSGAAATKRGTLFHEIMGQCAYPYQEEEMCALAKSYGMDLSRTDLEQLKAINANEQYAQWMKEEHAFELSYLIEKDQSIIHGFMDLVVRLPHKTVIVDYKTDHVDSKEELIEKYKIQLDTYKEAYQHIDASKPIETFLYSFHLKEMIAL